MNIQPGRSARRRTVSQVNTPSNGVSELCSVVAMVGLTALILAMSGAFFYTYVSLGNRISAASSEIRSLDEQIAREKREIVALKGLEARRSSRDYVMAQIRRYKLPLVPLKYHQTGKLTVLTAEQAAQTPLRRSRYQTARSGLKLRNSR